jgi:SAM-dependent methyltransferase
MTTETWQWDETLFAGAAPYYMPGRPPYAPGVPDALTAAVPLDGHGRLLDLGCGPGPIALSLAHLFEEVVGLDPDPEMLAEAAHIAAERTISNARWVKLLAEELPAGLGSFRCVTLAASFHWMDRDQVALTIATMLDNDGVAVQVDAPGYRPPEGGAPTELPHPPIPHDAIADLVRSYLGPDRRAGKGIRNYSLSGEDGVFQGAGFRPAEFVPVPDGRIYVRTIDDVVAMVFSTSSSTTHQFREQKDAFERDLRTLLFDLSPSGQFANPLPDNLLSIWRW